MRRSPVLTIVAISCLLFAAAAAAQAQTQNPRLDPVKETIAASPKASEVPPLQPTAAPGTEIYFAHRGESIPSIAHRYLGKTSYLTSAELAEAIHQANGNHTGNILKANQNIVIPGILSAPVVAKTIAVPKDFEVRAVYLTGIMAGSDHGLRIIRHWREVGGNAVVFDIKDSDGSVNIPWEHPLLGKHNVYLHDLPKFVQFLHSLNMHAIARIAIFRDQRLVTEHPELAVKSKRTGQPWRENGKLVWTDPSNPEVQEYDIALAKYVAGLGVDEIQFDYVRFPAEGDQKDASFLFQSEHPNVQVPTTRRSLHGESGARISDNSSGRPMQRSDVIVSFLQKAYAEIHPTGALFSLDVFGVMAWQRSVDLSHTGQDIVRMAKYCDVLSPMIYPSHFFGMDNIARPGDAPEHFIGESMVRFELITKGSGVVIRPWLQAFHWRTKTYSPEYIKVQVATAREKGGIGFLFWNAANDYSKPFVAMPEMKAENYKAGPDSKERSKDNPRFFRGDELPAGSLQAATSAH